jgi:replicative DNA helicase
MAQAKEKVISVPVKVPPQNVEAEQAILAGILINNDAMNQVVDILEADDFYREVHGHLYGGMIELYNKNEPIDLITLSQHLKEKGLMEKAGGPDYLASLVDAVSTSAGILYHAEIVRNLSVRRKLINQCSIISDSCFQESEPTDELLDRAEQSIFDIAEARIGEGFSSLEEVVKQSFKKLESVADLDGYITGVPSGFDDFDRLTAGLQPSDLIIIAGRPSMGKTALALNMGYNAAMKTGKGVAVFSLEMSKLQLGMRLLGFDAQIDATRLRTGALRDKDWTRLTEAANRLSELPIFVEDVVAQCSRYEGEVQGLMKRRSLPVVIDYLQLVQEEELNQANGDFRDLPVLRPCQDINVPVMALSQLNRKVEDRPNKRPQLSDLRESGAIEQDADVIAFIYRDELYHPATEENQNLAEIILAKQRNGPTGFFKLTFQKEITRFRNFTQEEAL